MIELDNRAVQFLESIRSEGERSVEAVRSETDTQIAAELEKTRAAEKARADKTLQYEANRADVQANRALSTAREQTRARLSTRRGELADTVFAEAKAALVQFTAGPDYAPWLCQSAAELAAKLGAGTVLYARTADLPLLQGKLPAGCTLKADDGITLGGLKAEGGALSADDTLATRLDAQRDWFLENSGLSISI